MSAKLQLTVKVLWALYRAVAARNDSFTSDRARMGHIVRHLGDLPVYRLSILDIDSYRALRLGEATYRGGPPSPATLDREVELLRRACQYAVKARLLDSNPLTGVGLLHPVNVRSTVVTEATFQELLAAACPRLRPVLVIAYDTGMRLGEVLGLTWAEVDGGVVRLAPQRTKTNRGRAVYLTARARQALEGMPRGAGRIFGGFDVRRAFEHARKAAGMPDLWFHDLRRSFVVKARRAGVAQGVVMRMTGHRTEAVFRRYDIVEDADVRQAAEVLSGLATL